MLDSGRRNGSHGPRKLSNGGRQHRGCAYGRLHEAAGRCEDAVEGYDEYEAVRNDGEFAIATDLAHGHLLSPQSTHCPTNDQETTRRRERLTGALSGSTLLTRT